MPSMTPKKTNEKNIQVKVNLHLIKKTGAVDVKKGYKSSGGRITTPKVYTGKR